MKPIIALVGRPNVGKSTLFNYLTKSNNALVADQPGITRDRIYGTTRRFDDRYIVIDTGGLTSSDTSLEQNPIYQSISEQAWVAIEEADVVFFLVEATEGLVPQDQEVFANLRNANRQVIVLVNKSDCGVVQSLSSEFYALGAESLFEVSAKSGNGIRDVMYHLNEKYVDSNEQVSDKDENSLITVALVGRPNVGKSTLANTLLGEHRFVTSDIPGTTRDSISVNIEKIGTTFELIDTAGVRRRSKVHDMIEKFSVVKTLQSIEASNVVVLMIDGTQEFAEQDARLAGMVLDSGRAVVVAINKVDECSEEQHKKIKKGLDLKLNFLNFAEQLYISAIKKENITKLMHAVKHAHNSSQIQVNTADLNRMLESAVEAFQPPLVRGRRIKLKYMTQVNVNPPTFAVHGNQINRIPASYKRYLENYLRKVLKLTGTPVKLIFKQPDNPYAGRRNKLTPRQQRSRKRLLKTVKKR